MLFKNKKGQAHNYLAVITFLFAFGIMTIMGYLFYSAYVDEMTAAGYYEGAVEVAGEKFLNGMRLFDYITVLIMVVLIIGVGVTSYRLSTSAAGFIITFILAGFLGFISYFFNYVFAQFVSDNAFTSVITYFPRTILVCTNLHWVMLACIIVGSITLYAKREQGQFVGA